MLYPATPTIIPNNAPVSLDLEDWPGIEFTGFTVTAHRFMLLVARKQSGAAATLAPNIPTYKQYASAHGEFYPVGSAEDNTLVLDPNETVANQILVIDPWLQDNSAPPKFQFDLTGEHTGLQFGVFYFDQL